jgi:putative hydrolase of the HAD superfamily
MRKLGITQQLYHRDDAMRRAEQAAVVAAIKPALTGDPVTMLQQAPAPCSHIPRRRAKIPDYSAPAVRRNLVGQSPVLHPKGVLFDLGGTLLEEVNFDRQAGRARVLQIAHNPDGATLDDYAAVAEEPAMAAIWARRDATLVEFPVGAFGRLVYERLGLTFDIPIEEVQIEFWKAAIEMRLEPFVGEALRALRHLSVPLGVVSNSSFSTRTLSWELGRQGLLGAFQFVMSSADYGVRKPHPAIFLTAAAKLGLKPGEIWFIGDSAAADVAGARSAGMTAVWYNRRALSRDDIIPDIEIRSWAELHDYL